MPTVTIDGKALDFEPGDTIMRVASRHAIEIPYYCWHPRLSVAANCRMCLVEVEKAPKLLPACQTACRDGMVVNTSNERVKDAQRAVHEFLLVNHPIDCPICDQAGECKLQDYYMQYQHVASRMEDHKVNKPRHEKLGPYVIYNAERCVMCTRCVRFMDEVAGERQLGVFNRGDHAEIGVFEGRPLDNAYSMNTVDVCPVGALTAIPFRFKQRVWNLKRTDSICGGCARGCNIYVDGRGGNVYRFKPRDNDAVNQAWLCDAGRLTYEEPNTARIEYALSRNPGGDAGSGGAEGEDAELWSVPPETALGQAAEMLAPVAESGKACAAALSLFASCEEAYVFGRFAKEVLRAETVALLERPAAQGDSILRVSDANPNRAGITRVLGDLGLTPVDGSTLAQRIESGAVKALVCVGHQIDQAASLAAAAKRLEVFVHISHARTVLAEAAQVTLPATSWVEVDGTWVNVDQRAQRLKPAFGPRGDARAQHAWLLALADRLGVSFALPSVDTIRAEMERTLPSFPAGSLTEVGPEGRVLA